MHGRLGDGGISAHLGLIDDLTETETGGADEATKVDQRCDRRQGREIPFEVRLYVSVEPDRPFAVVCQVDGGVGEATTTGDGPPILPRLPSGVQDFLPVGLRGGQEIVPAPRSPESALFFACHRPKRQVACPSCKRFRARHESQICGTGEKKTSRRSLLVDVSFDGAE